MPNNQPTIFDQLTKAINASTFNFNVQFDKDAQKLIKTAVFTLSAALVTAAIINSKRKAQR